MKRFVFLIGLVAIVAVSPFLGLSGPRAQAGPAGADAISAVLNHTCALKDGGVWCWGSGVGGGPKAPAQVSSLVPVPVSGLESGVTAISVGAYHNCALKDGGAWCWGSNSDGSLGNSSTYDPYAAGGSAVPVPVSGLESGVTAISVGAYHNCALKDGGAWCWGSNSDGSLGNSSTYDPYAAGGSAVPVPVLGLQGGVSAISAGSGHTCALKDGGVWCWGSNYSGQLGNSAGTTCTPLYGPPSPCSPVPVAVPGLESGVSAISAGGSYTCAVKEGGVWCWGQNQYGQLGNNSTTDSHVPVAVSGLTTGVTAISVGENHNCALKDGGAWCWGYNAYGGLGDPAIAHCADPSCDYSTTGSLVPVAVSGLTTGVTAISVGGHHTCALKDGGAWCWGYNYTGELGNGTTSSPFAAGSTVPVPVSGLASGVGAISAGWDHTCAVADGGVWCWGSNGDGSLGNNSTIGSSVPVEVLFTPPTPSPVPAASLPALGGVDAISAGGPFTCALKDGGVWCWGRGGPAGTLGDNSTTDSHVPVAVSGVATGVTAISSGLEHICALKDGGAWCWGLNIWGELGNDSTADSPAPVAVSGLATGVTAISAGWHHTCALKDGGVWCWGDNEYGQLGNTDTVTSPVPVAVPGLESGVSAVSVGDYHTCALKGDGVVCWGDNEYGQLGNGGGTTCTPPDGVSRPCSAVPVAVSGLTTGVTAISAGTCALKEGGVWCWGQNQNGKLGNNSTTDSPVPVAVSGLASGVSAISAGWDHTCALTEGGAWCWGYNSSGQLGNDSTTDSPVPVAVSGLASGVSAISAGALHTCALKDGGAWCWGQNVTGELGNDSTTDSPVPVEVLSTPPTPSPVPAASLPALGGVDAISAGGLHTCALKDGGAWCWGLNGDAGTLGNNSTTNSTMPVAVSGLATGVSAISSGLNHTCALKDGGAWCWGINSWGELGNDSITRNSPVPVAVSGLATGVTAISAHFSHACALKDGGVWCWGYNNYGGLGNNDNLASPVPVAVQGLESGVSAVSVGDNHTCALKGDGVVCWGDNEYGQLGNGGGTTCTPPIGMSQPCSAVPVAVSGLASGVTAISAGGFHTCALREGGVWCWGQNQDGQLGNNSTTDSPVPVAVSGLASGVSAISAAASGAGAGHTCALKEGGVWCWGQNQFGQLGNNSTTNSAVPVAVSGLTTGVSAISAGGWHTCALKDGGVWCWGFNYDGELGNDSTTDSHVPVAVLAPATPTPPQAPARILPNTGTGDIGAPAGSHLFEAALVMLATGLTLVIIGRRLAKNAG